VIDWLPQLGTAGFELLLPSGHGRRFASELGLLSGWLLESPRCFSSALALAAVFLAKAVTAGHFS
jgi:hypothetical protein